MPEPPAERRRRPRIPTMILCETRKGSAAPQLVRIRDLSECGMKIATRQEFNSGDRLWVRLPGSHDWSIARVVWRTNSLVGLAFSQALELPRELEMCDSATPSSHDAHTPRKRTA